MGGGGLKKWGLGSARDPRADIAHKTRTSPPGKKFLTFEIF